jgi:hypothetical protein
MSTLNPDVVIPSATDAWMADVDQWLQDQMYGTNTCSKTLSQLLTTMLELIGATNNCGMASAEQVQCFLGLLNNTIC